MSEIQITLNEAKECIALIQNLNLETVSIDEIKNLLKPLWLGYKLEAPIIRPGTRFYRGVTLTDEEKPKNVARITYPLPTYIKKNQRANRIGESRFYCSNMRSTTLCEMNISRGDHLVISHWQLNQSLFAPNIGYTRKVFEKYCSKRTENNIWWKKSDYSEVNQLIHEFFSDAFSKKIHRTDDYQYKLSIAISEGMFGDPKLIGPFPPHIQNPPEEYRFGILLYPSLARSADTDNAVLLPDFADKYLDLKFIEYVRIDGVFSSGVVINTTVLDFANSISNEGSIEWKGRAPHWSGAENAIISNENGEKVVRHINGELIIRISVEDGREVARDKHGVLIDPA